MNVETAKPHVSGWGGSPLRYAAEKTWAGHADESERRGLELHRRSFQVDGTPVEFEVALAYSEWVARGSIDGYRLTVESTGFLLEETELWRVHDLAEYSDPLDAG